MSTFSRFSAILIAIMLACVGIGKDHYGVVLPQAAPLTEGHTAQLSGKQLNDAFGIQQQVEIVVNAVNQLPAPVSKFHPDHALGGAFLLAFRQQCIVLLELLHAEHVSPGLSIRVIIFPFHYFW